MSTCTRASTTNSVCLSGQSSGGIVAEAAASFRVTFKSPSLLGLSADYVMT